MEYIGNSKERRAFMTFKVYDVTRQDISIMNVLLRLLGLSVQLRGYYYNSLSQQFKGAIHIVKGLSIYIMSSKGVSHNSPTLTLNYSGVY